MFGPRGTGTFTSHIAGSSETLVVFKFWMLAAWLLRHLQIPCLSALLPAMSKSFFARHVQELLHPIAASPRRSSRHVSQVRRAWSYVRSHRRACRQCSHCGVSNDCRDDEERDRTSRHVENLLTCFHLLGVEVRCEGSGRKEGFI